MNELAVELIKAMGKALLNPILYWLIIVSFIVSYRRVKEERKIFKQELFPIGAEFKGTLPITLFGSILISLIMILINTYFVGEIVFFLSVILFVLSFIFGFKTLSAAYTLGLTFIVFKILELFDNTLIENGLITAHSFSSIALLIALFLFVEAYMYSKIKNETSFPEILKSKRGSYLGIYHLQKASFVPFFVFMPSPVASSITTMMPAVDFNEQQFSFVLIPFFTAFHHIVSGQLPETAATQLKRNNMFLAFLILLLSFISFYLPGLAFFAVLTALVGKWFIDYLILKEDRQKDFYFLELKDPLKIFAVIPNSPASHLGFQVGDTIIKINEQPVKSLEELNDQLNKVLYFPSFEVITKNREVIVIENNKYRGNYEELGLVFATNFEQKQDTNQLPSEEI